MLHAGKRQSGVTLDWWLLRRPSCRAMLLTKPDGSQSAKTAGVKAERNRRYENNECFVCGKQGHKQWDCPQSQQGKAGKGVHGQSHGQDPKQQQHQQQQQQSTSGPAQYTWSRVTGMAPASATPTAGASGYKTASKAVVTRIKPAAPAASTEKDDDYVYIRVPREKVAPVDTGRTETVAAPCFSERWAAKCRTSPSISSSAAAGTRVAVSWRFRHHFVRACLGLATWRVWRYERRCGGDRTAFRGADAACRGASCCSRCVRGC